MRIQELLYVTQSHRFLATKSQNNRNMFQMFVFQVLSLKNKFLLKSRFSLIGIRFGGVKWLVRSLAKRQRGVSFQ